MSTETHTATLFKLGGVGVVQTDLNTGRVLRANQAFCEMVGYSEAELQQLTNAELTHPDDWQRDAERFAALQQGEKLEGAPLTRVLHKDGSVVWLELHVTVVGEGDQTTNIAVVHNVTERKLVEDALRESEAKYRTLYESIDEGYCIIEVLFDESGKANDYRFLEANPAFEKQTGLHDALGKRVRELVPEHEPYWFEIYGKVALTGESVRFENRAEALGRWYDVYAFRVGEPHEHRVAVLFSDIAERKHAEAAIRTSEERLRLTVESIPDHAIFTLDPERTITSWNPGAEQMFGYSAEEALGLSGDVIFTPEDREAGEPQKEATTASERGKAADERWHLRKGGSRFYASGSLAPIFEGEQLKGYVKIARDLTEQRLAAQEREHLLRELADLNENLERRVTERTEQLQLSEQRFVQAFEVAPIPATITTFGRETFLEVNDAFLALTRHTKEEVLGKTALELGMWSSREDQRKITKAQENGKGFRELELHLEDKDGGVHDVLISADVIDLNGEQSYLKMFYDITDRKKSDEQMHLAIQSIMNDASWFSQEVIARLNHIRAGGSNENFEHVDLSSRERDLLERIAIGWNNERIAEDLGLKMQTVRNYISNIYDKIGVHSRTEAAVWARERGITGK